MENTNNETPTQSAPGDGFVPVGERIIDQIMTGSLLHAQCAHDKAHGCVVVWSSGAAEQIEATAKADVNELKAELAYMRFQRDALLEMTWLDLPDEPDECISKWRKLFEDGWERKAQNVLGDGYPDTKTL